MTQLEFNFRCRPPAGYFNAAGTLMLSICIATEPRDIVTFAKEWICAQVRNVLQALPFRGDCRKLGIPVSAALDGKGNMWFHGATGASHASAGAWHRCTRTY